MVGGDGVRIWTQVHLFRRPRCSLNYHSFLSLACHSSNRTVPHCGNCHNSPTPGQSTRPVRQQAGSGLREAVDSIQGSGS